VKILKKIKQTLLKLKSKWKRPIKRLISVYICITICSVLISFTNGCSSLYLNNRINDFKDITTCSIGTGWGVKCRCGPIHAGLLQSEDWLGLRGGEIFINKQGCYVSNESEFLAWTKEDFLHGNSRNKSYSFQPFSIGIDRPSNTNTSGILPFIALPPTKLVEEVDGVPLSYYTECEVCFGLGMVIRLGINPGELLDFILGFFYIDILNDDQPLKITDSLEN